MFKSYRNSGNVPQMLSILGRRKCQTLGMTLPTNFRSVNGLMSVVRFKLNFFSLLPDSLGMVCRQPKQPASSVSSIFSNLRVNADGSFRKSLN